MSLNGSNLRTFESTASYTRPADTTAYAAGDALSDSTSAPTVLEFTNVAQRDQEAADGGQTVLINELIVHASTLQGTLPSIRVWFFNASPTAINDNAAFTLSDAENRTCLARMNTDSIEAGAVNNTMLQSGLQNIIFRIGASTTSVFALVEVLNAYTPASAEVFDFTIKGFRL